MAKEFNLPRSCIASINKKLPHRVGHKFVIRSIHVLRIDNGDIDVRISLSERISCEFKTGYRGQCSIERTTSERSDFNAQSLVHETMNILNRIKGYLIGCVNRETLEFDKERFEGILKNIKA